MTTFEKEAEKEIAPKDISKEFLSMDPFDFKDFLRTLKDEPGLSITIDWKDVPTARRLKAFLEDFSTRDSRKQRRAAIIRATDEQYMQELNVFASGVKREKV